MKHITFSLLVLFITMGLTAQTQKEETCHFGITFEISNNPCWGYGEPVILSVEPFSPAEKAGIKPGDIIMEINGTATYLRDYKTIASWLFDTFSPSAVFTIRNMDTYFKEYELGRKCEEISSLSESAMASAFSMYSVEDTQERGFSIPAQILNNKNVDYSDYHTFNFIIDPDAPEIDKEIMAIIEKALLQKGLTRSVNDPDMMVQTYYTYQPNTKYDATRSANIDQYIWRYDSRTEQMIKLPILSGNAAAQSYGRYMLEYGIRFFDRKYVDPTKLTQIWDCQVVEYLSNKYSLEEYARIHTPLLLMNFPYTTNTNSVNYVVSYKKYNYTGISLDVNDMKRITNVDEASPAYLAGIRTGDILKKIGDMKFNVSKDELTNGYKRFIIETMKYRDEKTRFTDANGYPDCMYWDKYEYKKVAKSFEKSIYVPNFSYLYNFNKYVVENPPARLLFEVETRRQKRSFEVKPEVRSSVLVRIKYN